MKIQKGMGVVRLSALAAALLLSAATSQAAVGLFNTGVDDNGTPLATGAQDHHWYTDYYEVYRLPTAAVNDAEGYPGYWMAPSAQSKWVTPFLSVTAGLTAGDYPAGLYRVSTDFDLTGIDLASASLQGLVAADNRIADITINGVALGFSSEGYDHFSSFGIGSGFVQGLNTLSFIVDNGGGPSGLRVELTGHFTPAVPEPTSALLMLCGVAGLFSLGRRERAFD